jgi:peptidoglycan/xylan/chitin deacetylase (PgdA/CDA1 family)
MSVTHFSDEEPLSRRCKAHAVSSLRMIPARPPPPLLQRLLPSPLMKASALLHLTAAGSLAAVPSAWPWAAGAVIADHLILAGSGLAPRSSWLGPNLNRLPASAAACGAIALTIDDGPDPEVTPRVLERLAERGARATFFCIGERVARYADLAREIVRRGHAVENHSQRHLRRFSLLSSGAITREITEAQETLTRVCGSPPRFFRAPAGLRSPLLEPELARLGLRLASWTRRGLDTVSRDAGVVLGRLSRGLSGGDILLLHDGGGARTLAGGPVILEVLPRLLDAAAEARLAPVTLRAACDGIQ